MIDGRDTGIINRPREFGVAEVALNGECLGVTKIGRMDDNAGKAYQLLRNGGIQLPPDGARPPLTKIRGRSKGGP